MECSPDSGRTENNGGILIMNSFHDLWLKCEHGYYLYAYHVPCTCKSLLEEEQ